MSPRRVLVLFAHPLLERSVINRTLLEAAQSVDGVTVNDLYEAYPDLAISVKREQELLTRHDVIVCQHPIYWFSTPAVVKQWQDLVLEHGWAYGSKGRALEGKLWLNVVSTGGPAQAYSRAGMKRHTVREFLLPHEESARVCRMTFLAPFVVHGALLGETRAQLPAIADDYRALLAALVADRVDVQRATQLDRINDPLTAVLREAA